MESVSVGSAVTYHHDSVNRVLSEFDTDISKFNEEYMFKRLKEEMVQGFTGMPNQYQMLLLCVFYNEVFYFQQVFIAWLRRRSLWFEKLRCNPYEGVWYTQFFWIGICSL